MANFDAQLQRMKSLMTYGAVKENKKQVNGTMEYHALGADGKAYGIIRENQKFYIKVADKKNEMVVEGYDYIGGYNNKKQFEYGMLSDAKKNFDMKLMAIKESYSPKTSSSLTKFEVKSEEMSVCGKAMMNEIARQRQIMSNAAAIMNEASTIGRSNTGNPEAPKTASFSAKIGEPFEETATAELDKDFNKTAADPEKQGEPFGDNAKAEEPKDAEYVPSGSVANQKPKGGKVVKVDESTRKIWEMMAKLDKSFTLNESCEDWGSCGLPSSEGVGSPEGHLMEDEEIAGLNDDGMEFAEDEFEASEAPAEPMDDETPEIEGEESAEEDDEFDWEDDDDYDFEDFDDEENTESEDADELEGEEAAEKDMENPESSELDDLRAKIAELEAEIAELKGEGEEGEDLGIEEPDFDATEFGGEEDEMEGSDEFSGEEETFEEPAGEEEVEETFDPEVDANYEEEEDDYDFGLDESRKAELEPIIEGLMQKYIKEDKLNVFGKHPGYRKKPMTLPATGSDGDDKTEDWNDESVYSEQPFGEKIGDSAPFDDVVSKITDSVMECLKNPKKKI